MHLLRKYLLTNVCRAPDGPINGVDPGIDPTPTIVEMPAETPAKLSLTQAARTLGKARRARPSAEAAQEQQSEQASHPSEQRPQEAAADAPGEEPAHESAETPTGEQADTGEQEPAPPGETANADAEAAKLPPIDPPRSWTKEDKELFTALPRATQERLVERERSRESDFNRRQQEATERAKGLDAERTKVEQVRQQFESALQQTEAALQQSYQQVIRQTAGEFADLLVSNAQGGVDWDIPKIQQLAADDTLRFNRWQAQKMFIDEQGNQLRQIAQVRQAQVAAHQAEVQAKFAEYAQHEDGLLEEALPEMADPAKRKEIQDAAVSTLTGAGFKPGELADAWQGKSHVPFRDHRVQVIIHKAALYDAAQAKVKTAVAKPTPPAQRPGVSQPRGASQAARVDTLAKRIDETRGQTQLRTAAQWLKARRASVR